MIADFPSSPYFLLQTSNLLQQIKEGEMVQGRDFRQLHCSQRHLSRLRPRLSHIPGRAPRSFLPHGKYLKISSSMHMTGCSRFVPLQKPWIFLPEKTPPFFWEIRTVIQGTVWSKVRQLGMQSHFGGVPCKLLTSTRPFAGSSYLLVLRGISQRWSHSRSVGRGK